MNKDRLSEFGIYRLRYPLTNLQIVLDTRLTIITFESGRNNAESRNPNGDGGSSVFSRESSFSIHLDKFTNFEQDVRRLESRNGSSRILLQNLQGMTNNHELPPDEVWWEAIGEFAFLLLRYGNKHKGPYLAIAKDLLLWLGTTDAKTAWRLRYDDRLSFEHRYKLLKHAQSSLGRSQTTEQRDNIPLDQPEEKERELFWWSTLCKYELAREWCEGETYRNPAARHALRESAINYLQILKDEPRQRDLKRFLSESGTDIEREVKRLLFEPSRLRVPRGPKSITRSRLRVLNNSSGSSMGGSNLTTSGNSGLNLAQDEVIRRAFLVWFLKRYDWVTAVKLVRASPEWKSLRLGRWLLGLSCFISVGLFIIQTREYAKLSRLLPAYFSPDYNTPHLWAAQVLIQLLSLVSVLLTAPTLFRLLMPRALFGSLLAWSTIIFTALRDLHEMTIGPTQEMPLVKLCHTCSDTNAYVVSSLISLGILLLDSIFIAYTVTQLSEGPRITISRTVSTLAALLAGSLFWGLIFALPIKFALERDTFMFDCSCIIPIVFIGSSIAVLFGLMVELIWQDQSLAEPLGEPL